MKFNNPPSKKQKYDNSTFKKINLPVALAMRFAFHPTLARMLWSLGVTKCFRGESATPRWLSRRPNLFTAKLECRPGSPLSGGPLSWRVF
jgi:hypothetical protein